LTQNASTVLKIKSMLEQGQELLQSARTHDVEREQFLIQNLSSIAKDLK